MIRERQIQNAVFTAGTTQLVDLPRDAVYHIIQISCRNGTSVVVTSAGTAGPTYEHSFPFSLLKNIRLIRNGSDVVFQGSGAMLAKESFVLNEAHPFARIYTSAANVETLLTSTVRGIVVPANAEGIGESVAQFVAVGATAGGATTLFEFQLEIWLQMGPEDGYFGTLVDARKLASFQLELSYANVTDIAVAGASQNSNTITANFQIMSYDQDNLDVNQNFGTFKRSMNSISNLQYSANNQQVLLPRGNYFHGILFQTLAQKANSTTVLQQENFVLGLINNRINSNFTLRQTDFKDLQSKMIADGCKNQAFGSAGGSPQGWAYMYYPSAGDRASELVPTYVMDQFDLQLTTLALASSQNGVTTAATLPTINMLLEEVIPGVSIANGAPRGAFAGSTRATSVKPYSS